MGFCGCGVGVGWVALLFRWFGRFGKADLGLSGFGLGFRVLVVSSMILFSVGLV